MSYDRIITVVTGVTTKLFLKGFREKLHMNRVKWLIVSLILATIGVMIAGCGGGGSTGSVDTGQQVAFFVTDDLSTAYDHVWVKFHEVELEFAGGSSKVFTSDAGVEIDLRALNTGTSNLFQFLGAASFPTQPVTKVKFTVGRNLVLFGTGATSGTSAQFASAFDLANGRSRFEIVPTTPLSVSPGGAVAFDFDLAAWTLTGGFVTPVGSVFTGSGLDNPVNHVNEDFSGTVSGLAGTVPNLSFTVTRANGQAVKVTTNLSTIFLNSNGSPSPVLANGKRVEVRGKFGTTTQSFAASVVKVEDSNGSGDDEDKVKGLVRNSNSGLGKFEVKGQFVRGFLPVQLWVNVQTSSTTKYFNRFGAVISSSAFFAALTSGSVEAEGVYNSGDNTLVASKVKLEDGVGGDNYQEAKGILITSNEGTGTLSISMTEWEGFAGSTGGSLTIASSGSTEYRNSDGQSISKAQFFAGVASATLIKVEGTFSGTTMQAKRLELRNNGGGGGGGNDPHEVNGSVSNINEMAGTFQVTLVSWFGFGGSHGQMVTVTMNSNATYRDDNGDSITKQQFFAGLATSPLVEVDGLVSGSTMTGVKAKLDDD